jgi:hypothetical protein
LWLSVRLFVKFSMHQALQALQAMKNLAGMVKYSMDRVLDATAKPLQKRPCNGCGLKQRPGNR